MTTIVIIGILLVGWLLSLTVGNKVPHEVRGAMGAILALVFVWRIITATRPDFQILPLALSTFFLVLCIWGSYHEFQLGKN